jgi:hypothetical protein
MAGKSAKRQAKAAAEASNVEAGRLAEQTTLLKKRTEATALKSQRILLRALRSRGGGFFETDTQSTTGAQGDNLGAAGSLN